MFQANKGQHNIIGQDFGGTASCVPSYHIPALHNIEHTAVGWIHGFGLVVRIRRALKSGMLLDDKRLKIVTKGTDWSVGYWEYCHRKHVTDDGGNLYQESKRCYSMDILPYRGQFVIHIGENDHIGLMNNVTHEMPLPGSCLQVARIWVRIFLIHFFAYF